MAFMGTIATAVFLVQIPFFAERLHLMPLHALDWLRGLGAVCLITALPMIKKIINKKTRRTS